MKTKEDLEKEKLALEIKLLVKSVNQSSLQKWLSIMQAFSVIFGIAFALNEFVFKDRESTNNKVKATLEYANKITDSTVRKAEDSLLYYRNLAFAMPIGAKDEHDLFYSIAERLPKSTLPLCNYYNMLENGIEKGYFDKKLCEAFLSYDVAKNIELLEELQSRHGGFNSKLIVPSYVNFKGLIEFYVHTNDIKHRQHYSPPQYDLNKPF